MSKEQPQTDQTEDTPAAFFADNGQALDNAITQLENEISQIIGVLHGKNAELAAYRHDRARIAALQKKLSPPLPPRPARKK